MKKILLISGSNRNGNTNYLLSQIEKETDNSEIILLNNCNIKYCKGCLVCHRIDKCIIQDDMQKIISKMKEADLIIFGVPNYFDNVTGLFKNFMDRLHPLYKNESIRNKSVIYIFTGGGKEDGTREEMEKAVYGLNRYLKLNVLKNYSYQALNLHDIEIQRTKINYIIEEIKNIDIKIQ